MFGQKVGVVCKGGAGEYGEKARVLSIEEEERKSAHCQAIYRPMRGG